MEYRKKPLKDRFLGKVREADNGCWLWTAQKCPEGYGRITVSGVTKKAHRVAYELFVGDVGGLHVLHRCDNPQCVNPKHLFLGTHADNMDDMRRKGRANGGRRSGVGAPSAGEKNGRAKVTQDDVLRIREDKRSHAAIAQDYGVHHTTVGKIKRGDRWASV